ncbi:hypothetical protein CW304_24560 [Bacillus sp. UFRGS-B20]|nr:hypothetical protein CW304_24560 [Bacillus sp. UFRGS-B20]
MHIEYLLSPRGKNNITITNNLPKRLDYIRGFKEEISLFKQIATFIHIEVNEKVIKQALLIEQEIKNPVVNVWKKSYRGSDMKVQKSLSRNLGR